jgi:hypothetical protein
MTLDSLTIRVPTLKMEVAGSCKTSVPIYRTTQHHILKGHNLTKCTAISSNIQVKSVNIPRKFNRPE